MSAFTPPPRLGGGIGPVEWIRQIARIDRRNQAFTRANEAERIADWLVKNGVSER